MAGLKAGIRAAVTDRLELMVNGYLQSYGGDFLLRNGDLDGLSFELGGVLELRDHWSLTTSYRTGELDYLTLPNYPSEVQTGTGSRRGVRGRSVGVRIADDLPWQHDRPGSNATRPRPM